MSAEQPANMAATSSNATPEYNLSLITVHLRRGEFAVTSLL
ncbi:MAG: hypothetical protein V3S10_00145 [Dehalococcoidales bacterium]